MLSPLKEQKTLTRKEGPFQEKIQTNSESAKQLLERPNGQHFFEGPSFCSLFIYYFAHVFTPWILPNNLVRWITSPLLLNKLSQHGSLNINIPHQLTVLQITRLGTTGTPKTKQVPHGGNGKGQS